MSGIPPHICTKKQHKPLSYKISTFIHKNSRKLKQIREHQQRNNKRESNAEEKLSEYNDFEDGSDYDDQVICCPKCKEVLSYPRKISVTSELSVGREKMEMRNAGSARYWQSYLRSTSSSWISFNTDSVYCY